MEQPDAPCRCSARRLWPHRLADDLHPEQHEPDRGPDDDDRDGREVRHLLERVPRDRRTDEPDHEDDERHRDREAPVHALRVAFLSCPRVSYNYVSGDDYVLEFLGYRFAFGADDFRERVTAAAVKLA